MKRSVFLLILLVATTGSSAIANENTIESNTNKFAGPKIVYRGGFVMDTTIAGEQKKDRVQPSYPDFTRLSNNRWLVLFQTRGFSGIDNERAILYQIRADVPNGRVIKEGVLSPYTPKWDPLKNGRHFYKQQGTPTAFGVPKGAMIGGKVLPNNNVFAIKWYNAGRLKEGDRLKAPAETRALVAPTVRMEMMQVRFNEDKDDLEIIAPAKWLVQKGYEKGPAFSSLEGQILSMTFGRVLPYSDDFTKWIAIGVFNRSRLAAMLFEFNPKTGRYEWTRTGKSFHKSGGPRHYEPSLNRVGDEWLMSVRTNRRFKEGHPGTCTAWFRFRDPFEGFGEPTYVEVPSTYGPRISHLCPDGVLRIFSGELTRSPYREKRNPLFCWDVDPRDFSVSNERVILDARQAKLGLGSPMVGTAKFSPIFEGNRQILAFRVTTGGEVTKEQVAVCGSHWCEVTYDGPVQQEPWEFVK